MDKNKDSQSFEASNKLKEPKIIAIILGVVIITGLIIAFWMNSTKTIDLNEYISVSFEGADGYGRVTLNFDNDALVEDYGEIFQKLMEKNGESYGQSPYDATMYFFSFAGSMMSNDVIPAENLNNGDKVTLTWNIRSEELKESTGINFIAEDKEYIVEGLKEVVTIDPFEQMEISFGGFSGSAQLKIDNLNEPPLDTLVFEADSQYAQNGDVVTIYVEALAESYIDQGIILEPLEKKVTVEGLSEYTKNPKQISSDLVQDLYTESAEELQHFAAENWVNEADLNHTEFESAYLIHLKPNQFDEYTNGIIIMTKYEASVQYPENGIDETFTGYYPSVFYNVITDGDGNILRDEIEKGSIIRLTFSKSFPYQELNFNLNKRLSFNGYETWEDVESDLKKMDSKWDVQLIQKK